ncbi:MAG TPA: diaminopimelate decarboxylase [Firmicutes bacterium]|nr:diaminopimelate decarboxylase [Bacillota bacterium]
MLDYDERGNLRFGGCDVSKLASTYGTPLHVLDEQVIRKKCREYMDAFSRSYSGPGYRVAYAGKALCIKAVLEIVKSEGLYLDVCSAGELVTALSAGFPPDKIYFHGNNKSTDEILMALKRGIGRFVVDNWFELLELGRLSSKLKKRANVLIRVAPGVSAHTHEYIDTGQSDSKFGFSLIEGDAMAAVKRALQMRSLHVAGLHCHIGSQVFNLESFQRAAWKMETLRWEVKQETGVELLELDMGGGLGVKYLEGDDPPPIVSYVEAVAHAVEEAASYYGLRYPVLTLEPGRSLVAEAGITVYRVGAIKNHRVGESYVLVDGGMFENPRHALYGAQYTVLPVRKPITHQRRVFTVAGKCCESGDVITKGCELPPVSAGDLLAVTCTGAYHYAMASNYNRFPRPAVVMASGGKSAVVVERESYMDLVKRDKVPVWLEAKKLAKAMGQRPGM